MNVLAGASPELLTLIMFGGCITLIFLGTPIGFSLFGTTCIVALLTGNLNQLLALIQANAFSQMINYTLLAVPLFIFMGNMIEASGITDAMFDALAPWIGHIRGGLLVVTIIIGTVLAACIGVVAASVILLTLIAMPNMLRRGYNKELACGTVCVSGSLGILIPPSIMLVIYGPQAGISVGKLFMSAFSVGFLLSVCYIAFVLIRAHLNPNLAPAAPKSTLPTSVKLKKLLVSFLPALCLVLAVLGSIMFGIAAPTEAAAVGCFGAIILAAAYRHLSWKNLFGALKDSVKTYSMVMMIIIGAKCFTTLFMRLRCNSVVRELIFSMPGGRWGSWLLIMLIFFILGMLIDWTGIVMMMVPIITPMAAEMGFDPLWFAMTCIVNLQMAFITPPMASAIFFLRGTAKPEWEITTAHIIRGVLPFLAIVVVVLILCVIFPGILTWLPSVAV
jgi:tripartite ATP-independent transporter DctM subunit